MIIDNELIIDGVRTSSFPFKVIVEDHPFLKISSSKTRLIEHNGISGAITSTNKQRSMVKRSYHISLIDCDYTQVLEFTELLTKENFWLMNERLQGIRFWCYTVDDFEFRVDNFGAWVADVTFNCHPTKYMTTIDTQTFTANGSYNTQGTALAFPTITIVPKSTTDCYFSIAGNYVELVDAVKTTVMINNQQMPSVRDSTGNQVKWRGDFVTVDPVKDMYGVVLGSGVESLKVETNWGYK